MSQHIFYELTQDMLSSEMQNSNVPYFYFALKKDHELSKTAKSVIESLSSYAEENGIRFIIHEGYDGNDNSIFEIDGVKYENAPYGWNESSGKNYLGYQMFQLNNVSFVARSFPSMTFFYRKGDVVYTPMLLPYTDEEAEQLKNCKSVTKTWNLYGDNGDGLTVTLTYSKITSSHLTVGNKLYLKVGGQSGSEHLRYIMRGDGKSYLPDGTSYYKILESRNALKTCIDGCLKYFNQDKMATEVKMTTNSEIDTSIVYSPTDGTVTAIKNSTDEVIADLYSFHKGYDFKTFQGAYQNFNLYTSYDNTFSYSRIVDSQITSIKDNYLSSSIKQSRVFYGHPNLKVDKSAYDDSDFQFYGILSAVLERNQGIFLYITDNTDFNADDRVFICEQKTFLGWNAGSGIMANGGTTLFQMGYKLKWDKKNNTYKTYSTKSAFDAYNFLLEKKKTLSDDILNDPLYLYYGKTQDGQEIIECGSFSSSVLKNDNAFRPNSTYDYYMTYLSDKGKEYKKRLKIEQAKCIKTIDSTKLGFYSTTNFKIDSQLDTLDSLRTGLWYSGALYTQALMQISENTGIPLIFYDSVLNVTTEAMPNNMDDIKWQPTEGNKLNECYGTIKGFINSCIFGFYGSKIIGDYSYSNGKCDTKNELRDYLVSCGCILSQSPDDDFFDISGQSKVKSVWDINLYVCDGFKCLKKISIKQVLSNLGMVFPAQSNSLKDKCPHVQYLDSITYKSNEVIYNNAGGGTTWWNDNLEKIRKSIKDEITSVLGIHTVTFLDWDGTELKVQKNVKTNGNATPPENPTREGYNFTKWEPTFTNVTSDLTCIAQYEEIYVPKAKKNYMRNQITKAQLSKNILSVGDYCFYNCYKLRDVELGDYCRLIGTSAFKDCTELSSVNRLNDSNPDHTFDIVGDYAFSNTNLSSVTLSLRGSSSFTFWGDYCFAYNRNLKRVNFLSSSYMSNNMFCDCSSLTSVTFDNNYTSYVYPYVFHNCTALKDITLPSKLWFISNSMFKGCSSLSSIKFSSYKNTSLNLVQDSAFNGCSSLTSIEFPESMNSLSCFEDGCFQNMPNLREIKFDGIETEDLMIEGVSELCTDIYYGKMYINDKDTKNIIKTSLSCNIPIIMSFGGSGCGYCTTFSKHYKDGGDLTDSIKNMKCVFVYGSVDPARQSIIDSVNRGGGYVIITVKWEKPDGTVKKYEVPSYYDDDKTRAQHHSSLPITDIQNELTKWGYDWQTTEQEKAFQTKTVVDSIKKTGCFRLNHDCTLISKDGTTVNFKYNPNDTEQKVEEPEYEVDKSTKTNFQTGTWYYNMKQLKSYADKTGKPILGIYSLLGCDPCTIYHDNIWNNENLQSWISSQNFYFCGIESNRQTYYDDQLNYCVNNFVISANNYLNYGEELSDITNNAFDEYFKETKNVKTGVINTNLFTPVIMMYGPQNTSLSNQFYLYTYHNISKWIDQCGKDGVVEVLKRLCLYHFENNDPISPNGFVTGVTEKFDKDNLPTKEQQDEKFKFYDQETGIVTLASYQTLSCLKEKLKSTFQDDLGEYVGGCQVETVQWMTEIGVDADIATNFPEQMKEEFEKVNQYKFSETEKYTLSIDLEDTKDVYSPCNMGGTATGYRMIWTR